MFEMDKELAEWLKANKYGNYKGIEITPQTELVSYTYVFSVIVMSFRHKTRYYFKEAESKKAAFANTLCNLCNLLCGWWGIPWGPIWTVKETACNIGDPHTKSWGLLVEHPDIDVDAILDEYSTKERGASFYIKVVLVILAVLILGPLVILAPLAILGVF